MEAASYVAGIGVTLYLPGAGANGRSPVSQGRLELAPALAADLSVLFPPHLMNITS